jgi:spore maturation protein CgeB
MKILVCGDFRYFHYEQVFVEALIKQNHEVSVFACDIYKKGILGKTEYYFAFIGLLSTLMNISLYKRVKREKPDILVIWRGILYTPLLLKVLKQNFNIKLISFNNDDPFSSKYIEGKINQRRLWLNFRKGIPLFDINLVYRPHNLIDYKIAGSKNTLLFQPYFIPSQIEPILEKKYPKIYDVSFIGHFTSERLNYINYLLDNNVNVKVFGPGWDGKKLSSNYNYDRVITPIYGEDYFKTIIQSKMCIAFLSKLNRDVYTRRNFEIPACGTCMVSERTDELKQLYKEGEEALFFNNKEELLHKVKLNNSDYIGKNGRLRALTSGYDINSRVEKLIKAIN